MRRTVSVPAEICRPPALAQAGETRPQRSMTLQCSGRCEEGAGVDEGSFLADVDCQSTAVRPGVSHLWVTPGRCGCTRDGGEGFLAALRRVLASGENFAVTYDFRSCMPDPDFTRGLAEFCKEHLELWADRVKSAALLVQDNVLEAAAQGPVAKFLRACPCPPGCPFVLCHSAGMVEEFFQACLGPAMPYIGAQFLSVVDVLDDPRTPTSSWKPGNKARACLASLAPSPSLAEVGTQAQMLHVLPNGDTRVIQSPPQDVVVTSDSRRASLSVHEDVKPLSPELGGGIGEELTTLAALAFDCPREQLRQIVGAHFHVGELAVDAETDSLLRSPGRRRPDSRSAERSDDTCAGGLALLGRDMLAALMKGLGPLAGCTGLAGCSGAPRPCVA